VSNNNYTSDSNGSINGSCSKGKSNGSKTTTNADAGTSWATSQFKS